MAGILLEGDHVTDEERAAHACALAAKEREKSLKRATEVKARVGAQKLGKALQFAGTALSDRVVEPGPFSCKLAKGDHLRIIDLEGQQAVDFLVYDAANHENRYNAANTIKINRSVYVGKGFKLISDLGEVLMTIRDQREPRVPLSKFTAVERKGRSDSAHRTVDPLLRFGIRPSLNLSASFPAASGHYCGSPGSPLSSSMFFMLQTCEEIDGFLLTQAVMSREMREYSGL
jgi:hypothetical protein